MNLETKLDSKCKVNTQTEKTTTLSLGDIWDQQDERLVEVQLQDGKCFVFQNLLESQCKIPLFQNKQTEKKEEILNVKPPRLFSIYLQKIPNSSLFAQNANNRLFSGQYFSRMV